MNKNNSIAKAMRLLQSRSGTPPAMADGGLPTLQYRGPDGKVAEAATEDELGRLYDSSGNLIGHNSKFENERYGAWDSPEGQSTLGWLGTKAYDIGQGAYSGIANLVSAVSPIGTSEQGNMALQVPPMIPAVGEAFGRLMGTPEHPGTMYSLTGVPELDKPVLDDTNTAVMSMFGGNAFNPLSAVPKGALAANAIRGAEEAAAPIRAYRGLANEVDSPGTYWASGDPRVASGFAEDNAAMVGQDWPRVEPSDIRFQNPLHIDAEFADWEQIPWTHPTKGDGVYSTGDIAGVARDMGHDGVVFQNVYDGSEGRPSTVYAALEKGTVKSPYTGETLFSDTGKPNILGSAIATAGELRPFAESSNPSVRAAQRRAEDVPFEDKLAVQHNMRERSFLHNRGNYNDNIPVPSLAISKASEPLTNFGEVSLFGSPEMAIPKGSNPVYPGDAYTARAPKIVRDVPKAADRDRLYEKLTGEKGKGYKLDLDNPYWDDGFRIGYLRSIGQEPPPGVNPGDWARNAIGPDARDGMERFVSDWLSSHQGVIRERIDKGWSNDGERRLYAPHTLDNMVKASKGKNASEGFDYGPTSWKAAIMRPFQSLRDIQDSRGLIGKVPEKELDAQKSALADDGHKLAEALGYRDTDPDMIWEGLRSQDPDIRQQAQALRSALLELPTEYFEAKPQRAVDIGEFKMAGVPEGMDDVAEHLKRRGLDVRTLPKGEAGRAAALTEMLRSRPDLLFSDTGKPNIMGAALATAGNQSPQVQAALKVARELDFHGFYSPSLEASKVIPQEVGTVGQMKSMLLKNGAKPKELEALSFDEAFPDPDAKVNRQDIEDFLRGNRVGLGQTAYGGPMPSYEKWLDEKFGSGKWGDPEYDSDAVHAEFLAHTPSGGRFESYSTPGGIPGSYRETIATLPFDQKVPLKIEKLEPFGPDGSGEAMWQGRTLVRGVTEAPFEIGNQKIGRITHWPETFDFRGRPEGERYVVNSPNMQNAQFKSLDEAKAAIQDSYNMSGERRAGSAMGQDRQDVYTSSHWPGITNPLLHYRTKDFPAVGPAADALDSIARERFETPYLKLSGPQQQSVIDAAKALGWEGVGKTRVLDEMQSDWAQRARDAGTRNSAQLEALEGQTNVAWNNQMVARDKIASVFAEPGYKYLVPDHVRENPTEAANWVLRDPNGSPDVAARLQPLYDEFQKARNEHLDLQSKLQSAKKGVPNAPFISNTSDWTDLGLKHALLDAARDPAVDRLAWAPGQVQADRYNLAKQVGGLRYDPASGVLTYMPYDVRRMYGERAAGLSDQFWQTAPDTYTPEQLPGVVGKDVAEQLLASPSVRESFNPDANYHQMFLDDSISVGGEGMKGYYDKIIPQRLQKLLKGIDPDVQFQPSPVYANKAGWHLTPPDSTVTGQWMLKSDDYNSKGLHFDTEAEAKAALQAKLDEEALQYPSIPITPAMRQRILDEGLSLFADQKPSLLGSAVATANDLPMDHASRMARAREMGFDVDSTAYRGLSRPYDEADTGYYQMFTSSPAEASEYAMQNPLARPNVVPAYLRRGNNLEVDAMGRNFNSVPTSGLPEPIRAKLGPVARTDEIAHAAREAGYDSATIRNVIDNATNEVIPKATNPAMMAKRDAELDAILAELGMDDLGPASAYTPEPVGWDGVAAHERGPVTIDAIFGPSNIRSVNAAFDPARAGENGLLLSDTGKPSILGSAMAGAGESKPISIRKADEGKNWGVYHARVGDDIAGYADYGVLPNAGVVRGVAVDPAFQRQGVASALHGRIQDDIGLPLTPDNTLSQEGYDFWKASYPEAVRDHRPNGTGYWIDDVNRDMSKGVPAWRMSGGPNRPDDVLWADNRPSLLGSALAGAQKEALQTLKNNGGNVARAKAEVATFYKADDPYRSALESALDEISETTNPTKPYRAYHGTSTPWEGQFDPAQSRATNHSQPRPYFANFPDEASGYALDRAQTLSGKSAEGIAPGTPSVIAADINISNPFNPGLNGVDGGYNYIDAKTYKKIVGKKPDRSDRTGYDVLRALYQQEAHKLLTPEQRALEGAPYNSATPDAPSYYGHIYDKAIAPQVWEGVYDRLEKAGYDGLVEPRVPTDYADAPHYTKIIPFKKGTVKSPYTGETLFSDTGKPNILGSAIATAGETQPIRAYHATTADFDKFKRKPNDVGVHFGTPGQANDRLEYLASRGSRPYDNARMIPADLDIKRPLRLNDLGGWGSENLEFALSRAPEFAQDEAAIQQAMRKGNESGKVAALRDLIHRRGYDGIVYRNTGEVEGSEALRAKSAELKKDVDAAFGPGKNSFSVEDQKHPAYKAWSDALRAESDFREANGVDSYIATKRGTVTSPLTGETLFSDTKPSISGAALATAGETPRGLTIENRGNGQYDVRVGGKFAGTASVANDGDGAFLSAISLEPDMQRQGIGSAVYDQIERDIGRPLVPSPLGLTDEAMAFWKKRLSAMPSQSRSAILDESRQIGKQYGLRDEHIDLRLKPLAGETPTAQGIKPFSDSPSKVLRTDEHGKSIVWEDGNKTIAVNDPDRPSYLTLWDGPKRIGNMSLRPVTKRGEKWMSIENVDIDKGYRGQGLGNQFYNQALQALPPEYAGIYSYGPQVANKKQVPAIHRKMGAVTEDGDHTFIRRKNDARPAAQSLEPFNDSTPKSGGGVKPFEGPSSEKGATAPRPEEYRGEHGAPDAETGAPLSDVSANGIYPSDFYGPQGLRYYGTGDDALDAAAYRKIMNFKNKPDEMVAVYRAIPAVKGKRKGLTLGSDYINPGDWVAINRQYAVDHGESALNGDYHLTKRMVPARELFTSGDSIHEWGWSPSKTE